MKVVDLLEQTNNPTISYEIIPPKRGGAVHDVMKVVEALMPHDPPFIDVTSHSAQAYYEQCEDGSWKRHVKRKRPGTLGLCAAIKSRFGVETVPHVLCHGFTREETEDALIELNYLGIHNVMALKGDESSYAKPPRPDRSRNEYALDLVQQIQDMNAGRYLEEELLDAETTDFCVGVAGYPEKHFAAPNMMWDVAHLKRKVDAGAEYIVTQMFFDNDVYFDFVERCRSVGINVPIVPGLKILTTKRHLTSLPAHFFVNIPEELAAEIEAAPDAHVRGIGQDWALTQADELLSRGAPGVHFYIMQRADVVLPVVEALRERA